MASTGHVRDVVIIGGGISGLTAAWHLKRAGVDVCLLESQKSPGGCARTERRDGFLLEKGPFNVIVRDPAFEDLLGELSTDVSIVTAGPDARARFIYRRGRLHKVPTNPVSLAASGLLSAGGKCRLMLGMIVSRRARHTEETMEQAATRRFGIQVSDTLVSAVIGGILAGDIRRLSLKACFPTVAAVDARARSLLGFALASALKAIAGKGHRRKRRWRGLISIDDGLGGLTASMGRPLGSDALYGCTAEVIRTPESCAVSKGAESSSASRPPPTYTSPPDRDGAPACAPSLTEPGAPATGLVTPRRRSVLALTESSAYEVDYRDGDGARRTLRCRRVVIASSAANAGRLLQPLVPEATEILDSIESASLVVLNLGFRAGAIGHALKGYGFLVPHNEPDFPLLGTLWADSIFPHHAPPDHRLIRVFIGGSRDPAAASRPDDQLLATTIDALGDLLDIRESPMLVDVCRYEKAIPQNHVGHCQRIERLRAAVSKRPGLFLIGNYLEGVSVNDCVRVATNVANDIIRLD